VDPDEEVRLTQNDPGCFQNQLDMIAVA